jgi:hypothetical protein
MRKRVVIALLLISFIATNFPAQEPTFIDPSKARRSEVALRVKLVSVADCNKYCWAEVEILKVLQNKSGFSFKKRLSVAYYSWEPGIPEGESTIYLERYNPKGSVFWKLLNGSGKDGVSHATPSPKKER